MLLSVYEKFCDSLKIWCSLYYWWTWSL